MMISAGSAHLRFFAWIGPIFSATVIITERDQALPKRVWIGGLAENPQRKVGGVGRAVGD